MARPKPRHAYNRFVSVSADCYEQLAAYAKAHDITITNALCDALGEQRQPRGRRPTGIMVPVAWFKKLGRSAVTRRKRLDRAVRMALDKAGAP